MEETRSVDGRELDRHVNMNVGSFEVLVGVLQLIDINKDQKGAARELVLRAYDQANESSIKELVLAREVLGSFLG